MKKIALILSLILLPVAFADDTGNSGSSKAFKTKDSLTFSSAYFEGQYTNNQLAGFGTEVCRGLDRIESLIENEYLKLLYQLLDGWIAKELHLALHETGHGLRCKALGGSYMLPSNHKESHPNSNSNSAFSKDENFFKFFAKKLISPHRGDPVICYHDNDISETEDFIEDAGGINNNVLLSEKISDDFYAKGNMKSAGAIAYLYGKIYPVCYASRSKKGDGGTLGDPLKIENYYKEMGISAQKSDIVSSGIISTLLSGTTWSIIRGYWSNVINYSAEPFEFYGFRVPDTFSYITSQGISYKIVSGYKFSEDLELIFGGEHVFHGKSTTEINLGVRKTFGSSLHNMSCKVVTTLGKGFNLEASCSLPVLDCLSINVGGGTYFCKSLLGERHAKNMQNGKGRSSNLFVSVSYMY